MALRLELPIQTDGMLRQKEYRIGSAGERIAVGEICPNRVNRDSSFVIGDEPCTIRLEIVRQQSFDFLMFLFGNLVEFQFLDDTTSESGIALVRQCRKQLLACREIIICFLRLH